MRKRLSTILVYLAKFQDRILRIRNELGNQDTDLEGSLKQDLNPQSGFRTLLVRNHRLEENKVRRFENELEVFVLGSNMEGY